MPFTAKLKSSGENINIFDHEEPRLIWQKKDILCKLCDSEMFIRGGKGRRTVSHFVHYNNAPCKNNDFNLREDQKNESGEHLFAKNWLYSMLKKKFQETIYEVSLEMEYIIKENGTYRVADVAAIFKNGWIVAYEIQLSKITLEDLENRTLAYNNCGIDVVWFFGINADRPENHSWCKRNVGVSYQIIFKDLYEDPILSK